ncbi:hypothetical protein [Winogradskyella sp. SM1960]|uniref:hypothetical protein n=1 Tax=Winogradskyella sp. SM1960 TaxID=2865955 RepID=UPI001CD71F09|nr:hypothetical protein [Winogradskyella sp. SM1960]
MISKLLKPLIIIALTLHLTNCSSDDNTNDQDNNYATSYAEFTITGPSTSGDYDFRDVSNDDEFNTIGYSYTTDDDPDLTDDEIQVYIGKSFTESHFFLVAPPEIGSLTVNYQDSYSVDIILDTLEDNFYAKEVTVNITELEINNHTVTHCKGTFSGSFYRNNLVESNVHQINGDFEINN